MHKRTYTHAACATLQRPPSLCNSFFFFSPPPPNSVLTDCTGEDGEKEQRGYWSRAKEKETQSSLRGERRKKGGKQTNERRSQHTEHHSWNAGSRLFFHWFAPRGETIWSSSFCLNLIFYKDGIVHIKLCRYILFLRNRDSSRFLTVCSETSLHHRLCTHPQESMHSSFIILSRRRWMKKNVGIDLIKVGSCHYGSSTGETLCVK